MLIGGLGVGISAREARCRVYNADIVAWLDRLTGLLAPGGLLAFWSANAVPACVRGR